MNQLVALARSHFGDQFEDLEQFLGDQLKSGHPEVTDLGKYVVETGGKRFRPALTFLFHQITGASKPRQTAVELGAVIELIHLATLAHDDVIDLAETRRNHPSLWVNAGNTAAVLAGDFIFSRAFRLLNDFPESVRDVVIKAVEDVLEGQILQEQLRGKLTSLEQYDEVNRGKTAALISAACVLGAWAGNPHIDREKLNSIRDAGTHMGSAFQMIDDLFDVFGDEGIGKPRWSDQRGGWLTWSYIQLIDRSPETDREKLIETLSSPVESESQQRELVATMEGHNIRHDLMARAEAEINEMKRILKWIPESELKQMLIDSSEFVIQRTS